VILYVSYRSLENMTAESAEAYRRRRLEHRSGASACSYVYSEYYSGVVLNIRRSLR